jgi:hypothetical protein
MPDTDPESFLDALAFELRLRGCPVLRSELREFVHDAWPWICEDSSPCRWATLWQERPAWEQYRGQPAGAD